MMETLRRNSQIAIFSKFEEDQGIQLMKQHIEEYLRLGENDCDSELRRFLEEALENDQLLLDYLQGRKYEVDVAWQTLRQYAENRFIVHRDVFGEVVSQRVIHLLKNHVAGVLKHRDKFGRLIAYFDISKWDVNEFTVDDFICMGALAADRFWRRPEVLSKGVVVVENIKGFGLQHARQHSLHILLKLRSIFLHSYPVSLGGIFYFQMSFAFKLLFRISKPLLPKKIQSRMHFFSGSEEPLALYEIAPPEILPTWMGGKLSIEEASEDLTFYEPF